MDQQALHALHQHAVEAGLASKQARQILLSGIAGRLVAAIPSGASPSEQLLLDLSTLARQGTEQVDAPLLVWLHNAAHQLGPRPEAAYFADLAERLAPPRRTAPMGVAPIHPLRFEPPAARHIEQHPQRERLMTCLATLAWPLRARLKRTGGGELLHVVSVLARDAGIEAAIECRADGVLVVQRRAPGAPGPSAALAFDDLAQARACIDAHFSSVGTRTS